MLLPLLCAHGVSSERMYAYHIIHAYIPYTLHSSHTTSAILDTQSEIHQTETYFTTHPCLGTLSLGVLLPVGESRALLDELCSLQWLGQQVGHHLLGGHVHDLDLARFLSLVQPEMADLDMPGSLERWSASLHQSDAARVILVEHRRPCVIPLGRHEVPPESLCRTVR
jgi:hypothetical protein